MEFKDVQGRRVFDTAWSAVLSSTEREQKWRRSKVDSVWQPVLAHKNKSLCTLSYKDKSLQNYKSIQNIRTILNPPKNIYL